MNVEDQKKIFLMSVEHISELNELMKISNSRVEATLIAQALNSKITNLKTNNPNEYLSALLLLVFNNSKQVIKIERNDINKLMVLNYINTILEELNIKELEFEVY